LHLNFASLAKFKTKQAEQAAEKVGRFVGRGFSHDVCALDSSGVLTPEARKCHCSLFSLFGFELCQRCKIQIQEG
jgi:hypothetical protein